MDTGSATESDSKHLDIVVRETTDVVVQETKQEAGMKSFLNKSQADLERRIAHYPDRARTATMWAQGFCRESCRGNIELLRSICEKIGFKYSSSYFNNILNGYYFSLKRGKIDGNVDSWCELVEALRKHDQQSTAAGKMGFIETPTYRCLYNFISERRAPGSSCKFGGITGPTGSQKSECLKYFRLLHNHGQTVYFEAPARKSLVAFMRKLAAQYGAPVRSSVAAQEDEIRRNVTDEKCIIVDNAQRLYYPDRGNHQPVFDYLLELQDDTRCTIILCFTEDFVAGDLSAGRAKKYFEQFIGRMGGVSDMLRFPEYTPAVDLRTIAKAYGLHPGEEAMKHLRAWSRLDGRIRLVFHRLKRAKLFAQAEGRNRIVVEDLEEADSYVPPAVGEEEGS